MLSLNLKTMTKTIACLCLLLTGQISRADLMITPTRVVFEEGVRTSEVTLVNRSTETKTYRIELQNKIQDDKGGYSDISADAAYPGNSAIDFLRYSPRVVTIEPGKYQKIKLNLRLPGSIAAGEYRVHLAMRAISSKVTKSSTSTESGMKTQISPKMSFSIPIIVRHGTAGMETKVSGVELLPKSAQLASPNLDIILARTGDVSAYGTISAYMKLPNSSQVQQIGKLSNVSVYTEVASRHVLVPLWIDSIPSGAVVQVTYQGDEEYEGRTLGQAAFKYSQ